MNFIWTEVYASPNNVALIQALLDKGADPNVADKWGETPLLLAAKQQHVEIVKRILAYHPDLKGIRISALSNTASTPETKQIIQMLKRAGAKE